MTGIWNRAIYLSLTLTVTLRYVALGASLRSSPLFFYSTRVKFKSWSYHGVKPPWDKFKSKVLNHRCGRQYSNIGVVVATLISLAILAKIVLAGNLNSFLLSINLFLICLETSVANLTILEQGSCIRNYQHLPSHNV